MSDDDELVATVRGGQELGPLEVPPRSVRAPFDRAGREMPPPGREARALWARRREDDAVAALAEPLAGVELGAYDLRIVRWLAGWDVPTIGTVVSLLWRARRAQAALEDRVRDIDHEPGTSRTASRVHLHDDDHPATLGFLRSLFERKLARGPAEAAELGFELSGTGAWVDWDLLQHSGLSSTEKACLHIARGAATLEWSGGPGSRMTGPLGSLVDAVSGGGL